MSRGEPRWVDVDEERGELLHWCESRAESVGHLSHLLLEGHSLARPAVRACVGAWVRACVRVWVRQQPCARGRGRARTQGRSRCSRRRSSWPRSLRRTAGPAGSAESWAGSPTRSEASSPPRDLERPCLGLSSRAAAPPGTSPTRPAGEATRTCGSVSQSGQLPPPSRQLPPPAFPAASAQHGNGVTPPPPRPA